MPLRDAIRATVKDILTLPKGSSTTDFLKIPHGTTVQDFLTIPYSPSPNQSSISIRESRFKLIILEFDSTLFDTSAAIRQAFETTFSTLLPTHTDQDRDFKEELNKYVAEGASILEILGKLLPIPIPESESNKEDISRELHLQTYRANYTTQPATLTKPLHEARQLLKALKDRGIPVAIVSAQTPLAAMFDAMDRHGLMDFVRGDLIVGDEDWQMTAATGYEEFLLPRVRNVYDGWVEREGDVLVVTGREVCVRFAGGIGAETLRVGGGEGYRGVDVLAVVDGEVDFAE